MNRTVVVLLLVCAGHLATAQTKDERKDAGFAYRFPDRPPLTYEFAVTGTISFGYEGVSTETMKVKVSAVLPFVPEAASDGVHTLRVAPRKTFIQVNDSVLEDFTSSESVSSALSTVRLSIADNGRVVSSEDISPGIVSIGKLLSLIPAFPSSTLTPGRRWKQSITTLSFPGIPMPDLEFWYLYDSIRGSDAVFKLTGDQIIRQTKKQGDVTVTMNGRSSGSGTLLFNTSRGAIEQSSGTITLNLRTVFGLPPVPGEKAGQSLPMTLNLKVSYTLKRLEPGA